MRNSSAVDRSRRRLLAGITTVVGVAGAGAASVPFVAFLNPSAQARAEGAPVVVDVAKVQEGQQISVA